MVLLPIRGKRGSETILYFRIICVVIAVGLFIIILGFVIDAAKDTILIKNHDAKDLALLITALYASPGNVSYDYPLKGDFTITIGKGQVSVSDSKGSYLYWYSRPAGMKDIAIAEGDYVTISEEGVAKIGPPLDGRKILFTKNVELTARVY